VYEEATGWTREQRHHRVFIRGSRHGNKNNCIVLVVFAVTFFYVYRPACPCPIAFLSIERLLLYHVAASFFLLLLAEQEQLCRAGCSTI
jgi:hypothetical protein